MLFRKSEQVLRDLIFVRERCVKHRGIVGIQRDQHATVEQPAHWMIFDSRQTPCPEIAADTDLDRDLALGEHFDEFRIARRTESMSQAFGANVQRGPDRLWSNALAGMGSEPQAIVSGIAI